MKLKLTTLALAAAAVLLSSCAHRTPPGFLEQSTPMLFGNTGPQRLGSSSASGNGRYYGAHDFFSN